MPGVPCPRCGGETRRLVRGVCPGCFAEVYGVASVPSRVEVEVCRYCGSVRLGHRWVAVSSFGEAVNVIASYIVSKSRPVEPLRRVYLVGLDYETMPNWTTRVNLYLRGESGDVVVEGRAQLAVLLRPSVCPTCKVRVSGEYDTLLQIRGGDPETVESIVEEVLAESGLWVHAVDIIRGKDGVDVYFTNTGAARKLAKRLTSKLPGRLERPSHETVGITSRGKRRSRKTLVYRVREEN